MKKPLKSSFRLCLACLLAAVLCLPALAACGSGSQPAAGTEAPAEAVVVTPEPSPEPTPEPTPEPPATPESRAAALGLPAPPDVDITSWEFLVANSYNSIHEYIPEYGGLEGQGFERRASDAANAFIQGARDAGYPMYAAAGYRNFEYCLTHYTEQIQKLGSAEAAAALNGTIFHAPGVNEHQTGLALDLTDNGAYNGTYNEIDNTPFLDSPSYAWALEHCAEYGFILRYPEGKEAYYGASCIPGHFRYVGVDAATYIMENNLCLEEFLLLYDENAVYLPPQTEQANG